jgi:hypothetical protein
MVEYTCNPSIRDRRLHKFKQGLDYRDTVWKCPEKEKKKVFCPKAAFVYF